MRRPAHHSCRTAPIPNGRLHQIERLSYAFRRLSTPGAKGRIVATFASNISYMHQQAINTANLISTQSHVLGHDIVSSVNCHGAGYLRRSRRCLIRTGYEPNRCPMTRILVILPGDGDPGEPLAGRSSCVTLQQPSPRPASASCLAMQSSISATPIEQCEPLSSRTIEITSCASVPKCHRPAGIRKIRSLRPCQPEELEAHARWSKPPIFPSTIRRMPRTQERAATWPS